MRFELQTRPYSVIDAINRCALATGSIRSAQIGECADYNGHSVAVYYNNYRGYWLAEYTWAGRVVLSRGTFEQCVRAAYQEHSRGALGSRVTVDTSADDASPATVHARRGFVESFGFTPAPVRWGRGPEPMPSWWTWKHGEAGSAVHLDRQGYPAISALIAADTREAYMAAAFARGGR